MSKVVPFPSSSDPHGDGWRPLVVTVSEVGGATLAAVTIVSPSGGVSSTVPTDRTMRHQAVAALRRALAELEGPDHDPESDTEIGRDWTPL